MIAGEREALHKHLDFIQLTITRMAANSFIVKGWSITIVTATLAFAVTDKAPPGVGGLAIFPVLAFWYLDGYFLAVEKVYRDHYDAVRQSNSPVDYNLTPNALLDRKAMDKRVKEKMKSGTIKWLYIMQLLLIGGIIGATLTKTVS